MANIARFDPFHDLVDDLFQGYFVRPVGYETARMKVEVTEKNGAYQALADLPGVRKEDIHVDIDGAQLTLSAEVKREKEATEGERVLHSERVFGTVARRFTPSR